MSIDDYLKEVSHILEVSQEQLENEYYMVDLPVLIEKKVKKENARMFLDFQMLIASNQRSMPDDTFNEFVENMTKGLRDASNTQEADKLDRDALEALRFLAGQGANRTGGG